MTVRFPALNGVVIDVAVYRRDEAIAALYAENFTHRQIAEKMGLSPGAISKCRARFARGIQAYEITRGRERAYAKPANAAQRQRALQAMPPAPPSQAGSGFDAWCQRSMDRLRAFPGILPRAHECALGGYSPSARAAAKPAPWRI